MSKQRRLRPVPPEPIAEEEMDPDHVLSLASEIINRSDLTPEEKERLTARAIQDHAEKMGAQDSAPPTSPTSPNSSLPSSTPEKAVPWVANPVKWTAILDEDFPAFAREASSQMLTLIHIQQDRLVQMHQQAQDEKSGAAMLALEKELASLETARLVATTMMIAATPDQPSLLVPEEGLTDANGRPLRRMKPHDA